MFVGVRAKTTERVVMDETGTYVVQFVRRVPEGQRCDNRLQRSVRGTPQDTNPGDVSTDLLEPVLFIPQLHDVGSTPTRVYSSDNQGTRNVNIRKKDIEKCGATTECRRRLEDAMTTDTSTAARVKDPDESGSTNPNGSSGPSGSGQHKRVRFSDQESVDSRPERDAEIHTGDPEAPVTRKISAETDAERLEEEVTSAAADTDRRLALKRKAEGDPNDSEVENTVMDSLAELWRENNEPDAEMQTGSSFSSVIERVKIGTDRPVCEEPKTPYPHDECGWGHIDDTCRNNTLVEKAKTKRDFGHSCLGGCRRTPWRGRVWHAMGPHQQG